MSQTRDLEDVDLAECEELEEAEDAPEGFLLLEDSFLSTMPLLGCVDDEDDDSL